MPNILIVEYRCPAQYKRQLVEHCIVVVIKLNSGYKDILDIATIWVGTECVVISRPPCTNKIYALDQIEILCCLFEIGNNTSLVRCLANGQQIVEAIFY